MYPLGAKRKPGRPDRRYFRIAAESPILRRNAKYVSGTRRASAKGPRADVGGRRDGAYRHCTHGMLPIRHDFDEWHQVALMTYPGRWVGLSLWLHAKLARIVKHLPDLGLEPSHQAAVYGRTLRALSPL